LTRYFIDANAIGRFAQRMNDRSLAIADLTKCFADFTAVDCLNLELRPGEVMALLGPSGCGKTTTLRMVAGLERPTQGAIRFGKQVFVSIADGIELPPEKRQVGMVFQSYALWPHMTVAENVSYPLRLRRMGRTEIERRTQSVLALINLAHLRDTTIPQLSGGQQQRVALARALVYEPSLMLFDEPFSNLDTQLRGQMRLELKKLRRKIEMTGLFVTHDQVEALSIADRVAIMNDGRIEQVGAPQEVYNLPKTRFVRDFLGRSVTFNGRVEKAGASVAVRLDNSSVLTVADGARYGGLKSGDPVELSIRPERISIGAKGDAAPNVVEAVVENLLFTGDRFESQMSVGDSNVLCDLPTDRAWSEGQSVRLSLPPDALSLWPALGS
jgi:ABC-type Fe3+/spermidine/putrescine transport system ATPase subunit